MKITIEREGKRPTVLAGYCGLAVVQSGSMPAPMVSIRAHDQAELAILLMGVMRGVERVNPGLVSFCAAHYEDLPGFVFPTAVKDGES